ncbi:acyl carrier protein [Actinomadura sp. NBRC 104425]|nr:acyl carrier protein [Actinomadura sp. NBRC 104425]
MTASGLDSMAAARLVLELQDELGVEVPLEWLGEPGDLAERSR